MKSLKLQSKMKNFYFLVIIFCFLFFVFCLSEVKAAKLDLTSEIQEISINQQFQINLFLDTENEKINAVEGKVVFPIDLLELKEIRDGNSMINFWIERPKVKSDNNKIIFSGITPGGYAGDQGLIFSMIFQTKKEGDGVIEIHSARALLNDSKGTEAKLRISNFQFLISKKAPAKAPLYEIKDIHSPELFTPEIAKDPNVFDGKWFLVFAAQDKESGIDHYEISEGKDQFIITESPYILKNQFLDKKITIKAIDKAGNERIVILPAQNPTRYENYLIFVIIGWIIFIYVIWRILRKFFKKK